MEMAMPRNRRALTRSAAAAGVTAALAACGTPPGAGGQQAGQPSGPRKLTYVAWAWSTPPAIEATHKAFSDRLAGVEIEFVQTPGGEHVQKVTALLAAGTPGDTVQVSHQDFPMFHRAGLYRPLAPLAGKDRSVSPKDFYQGHLDCYIVKGELYCLPGGLVDQTVVYANKRVFDAAGVRLPTEQESRNATWDTVVDLARKLTKPDGSQYGLVISQFNTLPYSGGAYLVDDRLNPTRGTLDDPRWARAVETWIDWTQRQKIMPTADDRTRLGERNWEETFARDKVAMYVDGSFKVAFFLQADPQLAWDMFWVPRLAPNLPRKFVTGGAGWGITPAARNPELAWEWVKFIDRKPGSYEVERDMNPQGIVLLSSHKGVSERELTRLKRLGWANADILLKGTEDVSWPPFHPEWTRINSQLVQPELSRLQRGEVAAQDGLKELNDRLTREIRAG
jgi:ABC-type glycerol-3-phosphate transport system substrate-binding protein